MTVWIHSPFDNLPHEGFRKQRYWLMAEAFVAAGDTVVYWTSDFNHGTKATRKLVTTVDSPVDLRLVKTIPYAANVSLKRMASHVAYARRLAREVRDATCDSRRPTCGGERTTYGLAKPDLIVSATPMLGAAKVLLGFARRVGARFVLDVQDAWPETFGRLGLPKFLLAPMYRVAKRLYREADAVTGVSERYRVIVNRPDYRVFYHGIAPSHPYREPPHVYRGASRPRRVNALLYLGNLGAGYDLATVIAAVAQDPSLTLDIAGKGPREQELRVQVVSLKLADRVRFHGYLGAAELAALAATCSVGVIPMRDDSWVGLPYKLGDYLAAGLPVISSLHGECGELLAREGLGVTYDFGSPDSFLEALTALPSGPVTLPDLLRADLIYPKFVAFLKGTFNG